MTAASNCAFVSKRAVGRHKELAAGVCRGFCHALRAVSSALGHIRQGHRRSAAGLSRQAGAPALHFGVGAYDPVGPLLPLCYGEISIH